MPKSRTGAKLSMHKFAQGVDISVQGLSVAEIYELVISRKRLFMSIGLNRIEDISFTPTWLHADSAWTAHDDILIVKPKIVYPSFGDLSSDDIYKLYDI